WSYGEQKSASQPQRAVARKPHGRWQWSRSPTQLFGVGALFFAVLGVIFVVAGPGSRLPLPPFPSQTRIALVPAGLLGVAAAAPFAIFSLLYWLMEHNGGKTFHEPTTKVHFMFTLAIVLDVVRVYTAWAMTAVNKHAAPVTGQDFIATLAFAILAIAAFFWNVVKGERAHAG